MENDLSNIIKDWVVQNKKTFWKYEVSFYSKTYKVSVLNLPNPSEKDITVFPYNPELNNSQKLKLCKSITKAYAKKEALDISCINVNVDYENGAVVAAIL